MIQIDCTVECSGNKHEYTEVKPNKKAAYAWITKRIDMLTANHKDKLLRFRGDSIIHHSISKNCGEEFTHTFKLKEI